MTSLYGISFPAVHKILTTEIGLLKTAENYAAEKKIPTSELLELRIAPDMLPLSTQVIITISTAKRVIERLTGTAPPETDRSDLTFEKLSKLLDETVTMIEGVDKAAVEGKESMVVPCKYGEKTWNVEAVEYVHGYAMPTLFFHLNMLYALLRGKGVPIGKSDYLQAFVKDFA